MNAKQCTVKAVGIPHEVSKEQVKVYFQEVARCKYKPTVACNEGSATVVYQNAEDAEAVLSTHDHEIEGTRIKVTAMPSLYLASAVVELNDYWSSTLASHDDVRQMLLKDHQIETSNENGRWVFKGNFYRLQNLHILLEDMMPDLETEAGERRLGEYVVIEEELNVSQTDKDVVGHKTEVSLEQDFDMLADDLYTDDNKMDRTEQNLDFEGAAALEREDTTPPSSLQRCGYSEVNAPATTPSVGLEDTQVLPVKIDFSSHRMSPTSSLMRNQTESMEQFGAIAAAASPLPATVGEAAVTPFSVVLIVAVGVNKYLKHRMPDSLKKIRDNCNVDFISSPSNSEHRQEIKITGKKNCKPSDVKEAQRRLKQLIREVDVSQSVFQLDHTTAKSTLLRSLLDDISGQYRDIVVCHNSSNVLIVGPETSVNRAEGKIRQGCERIRGKVRPEAVQPRVKSPRATAPDVEKTSNELIQELFDRGGATPSVMNDILNVSTQNQSVQRLSLVDLQPNSDTEFPLVQRDDYVRVAEQSNPAGVPLISPAHVPDDAHSEDACSFCGETDAATLSKLNNCQHVLCSVCMEVAKHQGSCPICDELMVESSLPTGTQPKGGKMTEEVKADKLAGFENSKGTIIVTYRIPDGLQTQIHPRPGIPYKGTTKRAYLPDTTQGREVLRMLRVAFRHRLVFTVENDKVQWSSGITHKTELTPNKLLGYPDETYLDRVTEELDGFGINMDYVRRQYSSPPCSLD